MRTITVAICMFGLATAFGMAEALDLTPKFTTTIADGIAMTRPYFADKDKKYAITLDRETMISEATEGPLFTFQKLPRAAFTLSYSSLSPDKAFGGSDLEIYRAAARAALPNQAD